MKDTEIELQAKIEHTEPLIIFLKEKGEFQYEKRQIDEYFTPAHKNFLAVRPVEEWLRLRDADGAYSLNYKRWHFDKTGRGLYADEFETKIENLAMAKKVFTSINVKPVVIVEKVRKVWMYNDYEISMDSVKNLGDFVEVEYKGKRSSAEHKEIMEEMIQFLKKIGCGKLEVNHGGYPALLLFGREGKFEVL